MQEYCKTVMAITAGLDDLVSADVPEERVRKIVHDSHEAMIGEIKGRGLTALAEYARDFFKNSDAKVSICFQGPALAIRVKDCPSAGDTPQESPRCRVAHILLDEVCRWAGYCSEIERHEDGECLQRFWREGLECPK